MELRSTPQRSRSSSTSKMSRSRTINSQTGWSNRSESCSPTWQRRKRESRSASLSVRAICRRNRSNSRTRSASRKMRSRTRSRSNRSRSRSRMRSRSRTRMRSRSRSRSRRSRSIRGRYRRSRSSSRTRSPSRKIRPRSRISSSRSRTRSRSRSRRHKITRSRSTSCSCSSSRIKSRRLRSRLRTRSSSKGRTSKTRSRTRSLSKRRSSSSGRIRSTSMEPRSIPQRSRSTSTRMSRSRTFTSKTGRSNRGRYRRSRSSSRTRSALRKIRSWSRRSSSRSRTRSSSRSRTRSRSRSTSRIKSRRHRSRSRTRSSSRSRTSKTRSRIRLPSKRRSMSRLSNHLINSNFSFSSGSTRERRSWLEYRYRTRPSPPTTESLGFGSSRFSTQPHRLTTPDIIRSRTPTAENISPDTTFTTRVTASNIASVTTAAPSTVTEAAAVTTTVAIPDIDREMFPYIKQEDIDYFKNLLKTPTSNVSHQELQKRELIGMLLKKKNGPPQVAKMSSKSLQQLARRMDPCLLLNTILPICLHPTDTESQAKIIASLDLIIFKLGRKIKPFLQKVLVVVQPLLVSSAYKYRRMAIRIVSKLTKVCGMASMIVSVRIDLEAVDKYVRNMSCQTAAIVASIVGLDKMFPFLRSLTTSKLSAILNNSGFKILQLTAQLMGTKARPHVRLMVELIEHVFDQIPSEEAVPSLECLEAVAATAKIAQKNDWLAFEKIWNTLLSMYRAIPRLMQTKKYQLKPQRAEVTQKAMAALLHLKPSLSDEEMSALHTGFAYVCSREGPTTVKILHKLLNCPSVSATYYQDNYLTPFITTQLSGFASYGPREKLEFIKVCTKSCQKVEVEKMCISLLIGFHSQNDNHIKLASETLVGVLKKRPREVTFDTEKKIITEFFNAINMDDSEDTQLLKLFLALLEILGERLYLHVFDIQNTLTDKPQDTDERKHLLDQVLLMLSGCSQSGGISGLVADGSIHNLRDAM